MEYGQRAESVLKSRIFSFSLAIATDQKRIKYFDISGHRLRAHAKINFKRPEHYGEDSPG
jgi:hypothetical protein